MEAILQSVKILFLLFTTGVTIYMFLRDASKGLQVFMVFMCISGFLGFARPIFAEAIVLPLCIIFGRSPTKDARVFYRWFFLLVVVGLTSLTSGNGIFGSFDEFFVLGFIMFAYSRKLFPDEKQSLNVLMLMWCYALCRVLWLLRVGGGDVMALSDLSDESTRMIVAETGLENDAVVDPNYFGFVAGLGAVLSFMYYGLRKEFNAILGYKFLRKRYLPVVVLLIGCVEVFFTIRGLSRGMLLALAIATLTYLGLQRKLWHVVITGSIFAAVFFLVSDTQLFDMYVERFTSDEDGSGRFLMWGFIWTMMQEQGPLVLLLGAGLNYPWWEHFSLMAGESYISTHSSWMTMILGCGLLGLAIFIQTISQSVSNGLRALNAVNQTKIVVLAYVIIGSSTIEPLSYSWGWIPLVVACSIWKKKNPLLPQNEH